jgi:hypothetical protein
MPRPVTAVALLAAAAGCVDRRFVVETNVPAAQVFVDGVPLGPSPADGRWEYAGYRTVQAVAPGFETATVPVRFTPKWHNIPPLDLVAEVLWPFRIEDVRRVRIDLQPAKPVVQAELTASADALRLRGQTLRPSTVPDTPRDRPAAGAVLPPAPPPTVERPFQGNLLVPQATDLAAPVVGPGTAPGR